MDKDGVSVFPFWIPLATVAMYALSLIIDIFA